MDSRFLESLIWVIETGSIAQAARIQHLTAAAVSQRIRTLEIELGTDLLTRTGHCAKPTAACARILTRARQIVKEVNVLVDDLRPRIYLSALRIGVIPSQWSPMLPIQLDVLRQNCPMTKMSLSLNTSRTLYAGLLNGEFDAIIIESPNFTIPRNVRSFLIRQEPLVLISNKKEDKTVRQILQENKYIEYLPAPFAINIATKYLEDQCLVMASICDTGSLESIKSLVSEGTGVSLVPKWPGLETKNENLFISAIENGKYMRDIVLLTSEDCDHHDFFKRLREILKPH